MNEAPSVDSPPASTARAVGAGVAHRARAGRVVMWTFRVVTVAVLAWIVAQVPWNDSVRITASGDDDGAIVGRVKTPPHEWHRLGGLRIEDRSAAATAEAQWVALDRIAHTAAGRPDVTIGLRSLLAALPAYSVAVAAGLVGLSLLLLALRWWLLARRVGVPLRYGEAVRLMAIGFTYMYAPGGMATGDVIKAMFLRSRIGHGGKAFVSVFADRLLGLQTMVLIGLVALMVFGWETIRGIAHFEALGWVIAGLAVGLAACAAWLVLPGVRAQLPGRWLPRVPALARPLASVREALEPYRSAWGTVVVAAAVGVLSQVCQILLALYFGMALGLPVEPWHYFLVVPLAAVVGAIPGLPGGLGLQEAGYVGYFALLLPPTYLPAAFALSLLVRVSLMLMSAAGLYWALTSWHGRAAAHTSSRAVSAHAPAA